MSIEKEAEGWIESLYTYSHPGDQDRAVADVMQRLVDKIAALRTARQIAEGIVNKWTNGKREPELGDLVDDIQDALAAAPAQPQGGGDAVRIALTRLWSFSLARPLILPSDTDGQKRWQAWANEITQRLKVLIGSPTGYEPDGSDAPIADTAPDAQRGELTGGDK